MDDTLLVAEAPSWTWATFKLKDVCTKIGSGATPRGGQNAYLPSGPFALIRSQNIHDGGFRHDGLAFINEEQADALKNVEIRENDILLNITGDSVARCCLVDPAVLPARVNQHVAIVRPDPDKLDAMFLRYWLVSPATKRRLLSWAGMGSTRNALTKQMIENLEIVAPATVEEQRSIASVLRAIDEKIEADLKAAEIAEQLARAVLLMAAASSGRIRLSKIADLRRESKDPSTMRDVLVDHYSIPALDAGAPETVAASAIKSAKLALPTSCVIVSRLNPDIPRVWFVAHDGRRAALSSTEFAVLTPRDRISACVLYAICSQPAFFRDLASKVAGTSTSHQRVRPDDVLATEVLDPGLLSESDEKSVTDAVALASTFRYGVRMLRELHAALLPALIDGRLRVTPYPIDAGR